MHTTVAYVQIDRIC